MNVKEKSSGGKDSDSESVVKNVRKNCIEIGVQLSTFEYMMLRDGLACTKTDSDAETIMRDGNVVSDITRVGNTHDNENVNVETVEFVVEKLYENVKEVDMPALDTNDIEVIVKTQQHPKSCMKDTKVMNTKGDNLNLLQEGQKSTNVVKNRKNLIKSGKKMMKKPEGTPEIKAILDRMKKKKN